MISSLLVSLILMRELLPRLPHSPLAGGPNLTTPIAMPREYGPENLGRSLREKMKALRHLGRRMKPVYIQDGRMTRLTNMVTTPASTALAIGDASISVIGLDPAACS